MDIWIEVFKLGAVAALVATNAFFVAAEFSLVSVRSTRVEELIAHGNLTAKAVRHAIADPDRFIAATQLGITLASLGLGWLGEPALAHLIEPLFGFLPDWWGGAASHAAAAGAIAFSFITFLHVVVGELMPKSIALQKPEETALWVARPILLAERLFRPLIWALNGTGNFLLRLIGFASASGHHLVHSVEELKLLVVASQESGLLEVGEREMLHAVFDFGDMQAHQVMVPRTEIVGVEAGLPLSQVIEMVASHTLTKFPVYEGNLDHVIGVLHTKDLVKLAYHTADKTARDCMREGLFVPETIHVSKLLARFRTRKQHIAILLDEYGGTAGLVTLEDLVEEIIGDVADQFEQEEPDIVRLPDGSYSISGRTLIEEVNQELDLALSDSHYETIAGYMLGCLGRMTEVDDTVEVEGLELRVKEMDGLRIARVLLRRAI
ncbi:MAG: HlyC/CorC family transporter [Thermoflexales bacterium]|nr:HlyC/CorC family transporter [Thermoflexales bacterium]